MTDKYLEDGETFTDEWKFKISVHPVVVLVSSELINDHTNSAVKEPDYDVTKIYIFPKIFSDHFLHHLLF